MTKPAGATDRKRHRVGPLLGVVGLALSGAAACSTPAPAVAGSGCVPASGQLVAELRAGLRVDGTLRHGYVVAGPSGLEFVSAELHRDEDGIDAKGDILTWATGAEQSRPARPAAVDQRARDDSGFPPSTATVRTDGAIASRGCVDLTRGRTFTNAELRNCDAVAEADRPACESEVDILREAGRGTAP